MLVFIMALYLVQQFSYYTLTTFLMKLSLILLSMLIILLYTLNCDKTSDLWQQLKLPSKFESDLLDTVDCERKWLVNFNTGKTQLLLFG